MTQIFFGQIEVGLHGYVHMASYEPRQEKTNVLHMRKQRRRSASRYREADQRLCFRYLDSTMPLLPKSKISSL